MPASNAARASPFGSATPPTRTEPELAGRKPVIASASSRCPLPETPASATISPARTSSVTPFTAGAPRSPSTVRPSTASTTGRSAWAGRRRFVVSKTRPTISDASDSRVDSAVVTVATARPPRSTVTRSETAITSCSLCEMKMTVRPSCTISRNVTNSARDSSGVSTAVGSSRIKTCAC
jgi:hypothetical protein